MPCGELGGQDTAPSPGDLWGLPHGADVGVYPHRTELHFNHLAENNVFGIVPLSKVTVTGLGLGEGGPCPTGMQGKAEPDSHTDGSCHSPQPEEKQKAMQQFNKLQAAMKVMGISGEEQKAFWLILGAIYHLGAAGATKGNELLRAGSINEPRLGTDGCMESQSDHQHLGTL